MPSDIPSDPPEKSMALDALAYLAEVLLTLLTAYLVRPALLRRWAGARRGLDRIAILLLTAVGLAGFGMQIDAIAHGQPLWVVVLFAVPGYLLPTAAWAIRHRLTGRRPAVSGGYERLGVAGL
jgi:hypothetical protein